MQSTLPSKTETTASRFLKMKTVFILLCGLFFSFVLLEQQKSESEVNCVNELMCDIYSILSLMDVLSAGK